MAGRLVTCRNDCVAAMGFGPLGQPHIIDRCNDLAAVGMRGFNDPVALAHRVVDYGHLLFEHDLGVRQTVR
ncbi:hypothetical protein D3C81_2232900 [compost metagenome]